MEKEIFHLGVKAIIRNKKGEILLLKINPDILKNKTEQYWDIPGGRMHKGENLEQVLIREVKEEIGIEQLKNIKPLIMTLSNLRIPIKNGEDVGLILYVYECEIEDDASIIISEEHSEYGWFNKEQASDLLKIKYPREFIEKMEEQQ